MPDRALRRSILQLRTAVRACRLSLAKPDLLCDIAPLYVGWSGADLSGRMPDRQEVSVGLRSANQREALLRNVKFFTSGKSEELTP